MSTPKSQGGNDILIQTPVNKMSNSTQIGGDEKDSPGADYLARDKKSREEKVPHLDATSITQLDGGLAPSVNDRLSTPHQSESLIDFESSSEASNTEESVYDEYLPVEKQRKCRICTDKQEGGILPRKSQRYPLDQYPASPNKSDAFLHQRGDPSALLDHVQSLEQEIGRLRSLLTKEERLGPPSAWKVLHRVSCANEPEPRIYTDEPFKTKYSNRQWHLHGRDSVKNIEIYIERHKELAFIVYLNYVCEGHTFRTGGRTAYDQILSVTDIRAGETDHEMRHNSRRRDQNDDNVEIKPIMAYLYIICDVLHEGMLNLLHQDPVLKSIIKYNEDVQQIPVPFLAYYHFRATIQAAIDELDDEDEQAQLQLLSTYISSAYSDEFAQADSMLARGVVTQPFLKYLFIPNEVIIETKDGKPTGYLQKGFLKSPSPRFRWRQDDENLIVASLTAQNWFYNGEFMKQSEELDVIWSKSANGEQEFSKLNVYPLRYASDELKQSLAARGKTFWDCRKHKYVEYQQATSKKMQSSVSLSVRFKFLKRIH